MSTWRASCADRAGRNPNEHGKDLESGRLFVEMPKNAMIKHFLDGANDVSWVLFMLDWTLVRLEDDVEEFIVGDTPISLYDPAPVFPGGGVGVLSSPNTQMFLPLGPRLGLLLESNEDVWNWARDNLEQLHEMTNEERAEKVDAREGRWAEGTATAESARELKLRSYAHAERFVFGSQKGVQDVRAARRSRGARLAAVAPPGPHVHMIVDDPTSPTRVRITRTFAPKRRD